MTPTKEQIYELAKELWFQDRLRREGAQALAINPEIEELKEEGFILAAQHELMTNMETSESRTYLEELAHSQGYTLKKESEAYLKTCVKTNMFSIPFDLDEAKKSNVLISGTNHSGKSRLACGICSLLTRFNWQIVAFDNSSVWREISDLEYVFTIEGKIPIFEDLDIIYDLSYVTPKKQRKLVDDFFKRYWNLTRRRAKKKRRQTLIVLEEFQMYGRNSRYSDNLARIMCTGRNLKLRVLAITVDLALVDPFL